MEALEIRGLMAHLSWVDLVLYALAVSAATLSTRHLRDQEKVGRCFKEKGYLG